MLFSWDGQARLLGLSRVEICQEEERGKEGGLESMVDVMGHDL